MAGVARHSDRFFSHDLFYKQAAEGTLPAFSWISPPHEAAGEKLPLVSHSGSFHDIERDAFCQDRLGSNVKETQKHGGDSHTDHPCMDMAKGERLLKDLYEALRAGKGWDKT